MPPTTEYPYYIKGSYQTNDPWMQISHLVRGGSDARRLHVPVRCLASLKGEGGKADEIERILLSWDDPSFAGLADRALVLLHELDQIFTAGNGTDMMTLGEIRVPFNALSIAISRRQQELAALRDERV